MKIPPFFGVAKEQVEVFNKIIAVIYSQIPHQKNAPALYSQAMVSSNPFFLKQSTPLET